MSTARRFFAILFLASSGCSAPPGSVIGRAGGVVVGDGATLTILPGALDREQTISILATDDPAPAGYLLASRIFRFAPEGLVFQIPAIVALPLDTVVPARLFWSQPSGSNYEEILAVAEGATVTGAITHFSKGFGGQPASPDGGAADGATLADLNPSLPGLDFAAPLDLGDGTPDEAVPDLAFADLSGPRGLDLAARDGGRDGGALGDLAGSRIDGSLVCPDDAASPLNVPAPALPCKQIPGWAACIELDLGGAVGPIDLVQVSDGNRLYSIAPAKAPPFTVGVAIDKQVFLDSGMQTVGIGIIVTAFAHGQVVANSGQPLLATVNENGLAGYAVTLMAAQMDHCHDSITDDNETDVDCGGSCGNTCSEGQRCHLDGDCIPNRALFCNCGICENHCKDGARDFDETDSDCGGSCSQGCALGQQCRMELDCQSIECDEPPLEIHHPPSYFYPAGCVKGRCEVSCADGVVDGLETDIDCGSSNAPPQGFNCRSPIPTCNGCAKGKSCWANEDCLSGSCSMLRVCD